MQSALDPRNPEMDQLRNEARISACVKAFAVVMMIAIASLPSFAQYALTCASEDGHRHYCATDTRGGVTMQRQRSKSACVQGSTWGFDQQGVWVDRGCRADFIVNTRQVDSAWDRNKDRDHDHDRDHDGDHDRDRNHDRDGDHDRFADRDHDRDHDRGREETMQLTCSSEDGGRHYCESDIQGTATMLRQRSGSACRQGYSWGNDRRGIWVDHGCRADFELRGHHNWNAAGYAPMVSTLKCSSDL